jgi:hypothetical protein
MGGRDPSRREKLTVNSRMMEAYVTYMHARYVYNVTKPLVASSTFPAVRGAALQAALLGEATRPQLQTTEPGSRGANLTLEAKRFIVEMYETMTGRKLLESA